MKLKSIAAGLAFVMGAIAGSPAVAADPNKLWPTWHVGMFSRANCGNNESISWERLGNLYWRLYTTSSQVNLDANPPTWYFLTDGPAITDRSAAIRWGGALDGGFWQVEGVHMIQPAEEVDQTEGWALVWQNCTDSFGGATAAMEDCKMSFADNCNLDEW